MKWAARDNPFQKCVSRTRLSTLMPNLSRVAICSSLRNSWGGLDGHSLTISNSLRKSQIWVETWWFLKNCSGSSRPKRTISWWHSMSADKYTKLRKARLLGHRRSMMLSVIGFSMRLLGKQQGSSCSGLPFLKDWWIEAICCGLSKSQTRNVWSFWLSWNSIFRQLRPSMQSWTRRSVLFRGSCWGACALIFQKMRMTTHTNR